MLYRAAFIFTFYNYFCLFLKSFRSNSKSISLKKITVIFLLLLFNKFGKAQFIKILADSVSSSFRGISVVNNRVVWVSGSNGKVGRSIDGGASWKWMIVRGFENRDFRDIEAFNKKTAIIMAVSEPAIILRTTDGGITWKIVFEDQTKGMFLDAMEFWNKRNGIVIGDPINQRVFIATTRNGGKAWQKVAENIRPGADSGEAFFASSGTNVRKINKAEVAFVSGGVSSNLFINDKKINLPITHGKQMTGANSIAVNGKILVIVGGDFTKAESTDSNCVVSFNNGKSFQKPTQPPYGYRSCVEYLRKNIWLSCGLNGVDLSRDNGISWRNISKESFHVCKKARRGKAIFLAGKNGRIARLYPKFS